VDHALCELRVELACGDRTRPALRLRVRVTIEYEYQVEVRAVAKLDATELAVGNDGEGRFVGSP